jgi:CRP-like cAMP-binding protein
MSVAESLRKSPVFASLDDETLERVAARFSEVEIPANQVLIEPRAPGAGLFLICDGSVAVEAHDVHRELGPGEVVGEISLLEADGTRSARVTARTPLRVLALTRADFEQVLREAPALEPALRELARMRLADLASGP